MEHPHVSPIYVGAKQLLSKYGYALNMLLCQTWAIRKTRAI